MEQGQTMKSCILLSRILCPPGKNRLWTDDGWRRGRLRFGLADFYSSGIERVVCSGEFMAKPFLRAAMECSWFGTFLFLVVLTPCSANAAGVTIITHGFDGDVTGWITAMADEIPTYYSFPGTNFTVYTITLTTDGNGNYYYQWARTNSGPSATDSGE